jgi:ABC-type Fe3+-siderophore transport system permease subunit
MYTVISNIDLLLRLLPLALVFLLVMLVVLRLFRRTQLPYQEMEVGVSTVVDL